MSRHSPGTLIFVIAAFAGTAQAQSVRVIDGDTIVLDRIHYRLWGIDAPEIVRYSRDYVDEEGAANAAHLGIFAHHCEPAWEWRSEHKR
jgi:endonuclease YncB( thermonuclease family)